MAHQLSLLRWTEGSLSDSVVVSDFAGVGVPLLPDCAAAVHAVLDKHRRLVSVCGERLLTV
jgi:hypothetical protein